MNNYSTHLEDMENFVRYLKRATKGSLFWQPVYNVDSRPDNKPDFSLEIPPGIIDAEGTLLLENRSTDDHNSLGLYLLVTGRPKILLYHHMTPRGSDFVNELLELYNAATENANKVLRVLTLNAYLSHGLIHAPFILGSIPSRVNKPPDTSQHNINPEALIFAHILKRFL